MSTRVSTELRKQAVRAVLIHRANYPSQIAACRAIAPTFSLDANSLCRWVTNALRQQLHEPATSQRLRPPTRPLRDTTSRQRDLQMTSRCDHR